MSYTPGIALKWMARFALPAGIAALSGGCPGSASYTIEPKTIPAPVVSTEQRIVDDSTVALERMRTGPAYPALDTYLRNARGVIILPHVTRAALVVGGEGGNGVLMSRDFGGRWSSPAFYSIRGGSAGPQIGYERATVVLVLMTDRALEAAVSSGLTLGANVSVAAGTLGTAGEERGVVAASDVFQFTEVGGVFAGASLYGAELTPGMT